MGSLIVRAVAAAMAAVAGFGEAGAPDVPSSPVQVGTGATPHRHTETASWRTLILMFISAIVVGTAVLMYVVRQRRRLLERRRLRRMADAARLAAAGAFATSDVGDSAVSPVVVAAPVGSPASDARPRHPATVPHHTLHPRPPGRQRVT
jgi:hypothetical protein